MSQIMTLTEVRPPDKLSTRSGLPMALVYDFKMAQYLKQHVRLCKTCTYWCCRTDNCDKYHWHWIDKEYEFKKMLKERYHKGKKQCQWYVKRWIPKSTLRPPHKALNVTCHECGWKFVSRLWDPRAVICVNCKSGESLEFEEP